MVAMLLYILHKYYLSKRCIYFHAVTTHHFKAVQKVTLVSRFKISSKRSVVTADYRKI